MNFDVLEVFAVVVIVLSLLAAAAVWYAFW
jgi:hypothetical protein